MKSTATNDAGDSKDSPEVIVVKVTEPPTITKELMEGDKKVEIKLPERVKVGDKLNVKVNGKTVKTVELTEGDIESGKTTVTVDEELKAGQKVTSTITNEVAESERSNEKIVAKANNPLITNRLIDGNNTVEVKLPKEAKAGNKLTIKVDGNKAKTITLTEKQVEEGTATVDLDNSLIVDQKVTATVKYDNGLEKTSEEKPVLKAPNAPTIEHDLTDGDAKVDIILPERVKSGDKLRVKINGNTVKTVELKDKDVESGKITVTVDSPLVGGQKVESTVENEVGESKLSYEKIVALAPPTIENDLTDGDTKVEITLPAGVKAGDKLRVQVDGEVVKPKDGEPDGFITLTEEQIKDNKVTVTLETKLVGNQKVTSNIENGGGISKLSNEKIVKLAPPEITNKLIDGKKDVEIKLPEKVKAGDKLNVKVDGKVVKTIELNAEDITNKTVTATLDNPLVVNQKVTSTVTNEAGDSKDSPEVIVVKVTEPPTITKELMEGDKTVDIKLPERVKTGDELNVKVNGTTVITVKLTDKDVKSGTTTVTVDEALEAGQKVTSTITNTAGESKLSNEKIVAEKEKPLITNDLFDGNTKVEIKLPKEAKAGDKLRVQVDTKDVNLKDGEKTVEFITLTEDQVKTGRVEVNVEKPLKVDQKVTSTVTDENDIEKKSNEKPVLKVTLPPTITNDLKDGDKTVEIKLPDKVKEGDKLNVKVNGTTVKTVELKDKDVESGEITVTVDSPLVGGQKVTSTITNNAGESELSNEKIVALAPPTVINNYKDGNTKVEITLPVGAKAGDKLKVQVDGKVVKPENGGKTDGYITLTEEQINADKVTVALETQLVGGQKITSTITVPIKDSDEGIESGESNEKIVKLAPPTITNKLKDGDTKVEIQLPEGAKEGDILELQVGGQPVEVKDDEGNNVDTITLTRAHTAGTKRIFVTLKTPLLGDQVVTSTITPEGSKEKPEISKEKPVALAPPTVVNYLIDGGTKVDIKLPEGVKTGDKLTLKVHSKDGEKDAEVTEEKTITLTDKDVENLKVTVTLENKLKTGQKVTGTIANENGEATSKEKPVAPIYTPSASKIQPPTIVNDLMEGDKNIDLELPKDAKTGDKINIKVDDKTVHTQTLTDKDIKRGKITVEVKTPLENKQTVTATITSGTMESDLSNKKIVGKVTSAINPPTIVNDLVEGDKNIDLELPKDAKTGDKINIKVDGKTVHTQTLTAEDIKRGKLTVEVKTPLVARQKVTSTITSGDMESDLSNEKIVVKKNVDERKPTDKMPKTGDPGLAADMLGLGLGAFGALLAGKKKKEDEED